VNLGFHIPFQYQLEPRLKALKIATEVVHSTHVKLAISPISARYMKPEIPKTV
jgi:hypothetical protein